MALSKKFKNIISIVISLLGFIGGILFGVGINRRRVSGDGGINPPASDGLGDITDGIDESVGRIEECQDIIEGEIERSNGMENKVSRILKILRNAKHRPDGDP